MTDRPAPCVRAGRKSIFVEPESDISRFAIGAEAARLSPGGQSDHYFSLIRADPNAPCPTVTKTGGNPSTAGVVHPSGRRKFSIAELRRICSFPDDFVLAGSYAQQWARLGNAVPPMMMYHIASAVCRGVFGREPSWIPDGRA